MIFVFVALIFAFSPSQTNGFLAYADPGDITDVILDDLEFDDNISSNTGDEPVITTVARGVVAVVFGEDDGTGVLATFKINDNGSVSLIERFVFEEETHQHTQQIIQVSGDIFAIAYTGGGGPSINNAILVTIEIDSKGRIGAVIDRLEDYNSPDDSDDEGMTMILVSPGVVAVAFEGAGNPCEGCLYTIGISPDGTITGVIELFEFEDGAAGYNMAISGTTFRI